MSFSSLIGSFQESGFIILCFDNIPGFGDLENVSSCHVKNAQNKAPLHMGKGICFYVIKLKIMSLKEQYEGCERVKRGQQLSVYKKL